MPSEGYAVQFTRAAEKELKGLRGNAEAALRAILRLEDQPELGHALTGDLSGTRSLEFSLKGSGAFRALDYLVPDERTCIVFILGPHEGIYARAERRLKQWDRGKSG